VTGHIDAHATYTAPGVEITASITEADLTDLTHQQRFTLAVIATLVDKGHRGSLSTSAAPAPESSTDTGEGEAIADGDQLHDTAGESSGSPAPTPPAPTNRATRPPARPSRATPKGARRDSAQTRLLDLLADGPLTGTLEEIASDVDCSYGALRQLLTKAVAKGTITRTRDGKQVTLALPGNEAS
jgi:hypothetical protein